MNNHTLKYIYIFFLLTLASLLVFIVQGMYQQEAKQIKPVEFRRVDGYNAQLGNISEVQVRINNDDSIGHNYTVQVFMNSVSFTDETVEVMPQLPFTLSITLPTEKQRINSTVEDAVHNYSFIVYRDDRGEPIDSIEFRFD